MFPVKTILCPLDFSSNSLQALKTAEEMAVHFSAELILVHVVPPFPERAAGQGEPIGYNAPSGIGTFALKEYRERLKGNAEEMLGKAAEEELDTDINSKTVVLQGGQEADEINKCAEETGADIIIISSHGRTGLKRVIFGAVAEKIIRESPIPVLTLPGTHNK